MTETVDLQHFPQAMEPPSPRALVAMLGHHPSKRLGLDLAGGPETDVESWLVASALLAGRVATRQGEQSFGALGAAGIARPESIAAAGAEAVLAVLEAAGHPRAEIAASLLARLATSLAQRGENALDTLGRGASDLEELGAKLSGLARGFGAGRIARFLQPLRDTWSAAAALPIEPYAAWAAWHLSWLHPDEPDPETLRRILADEDCGTKLADLEFALAQLGRRACRRDRPERCPLAEACPRRSPAFPERP